MAGVDDYMRLLRGSATEIQTLFQERLIPATSFFREPRSFEFVQTKLLPRLLAERPPHETLRVWVVGCSTGEEAYSLAMIFTEAAEVLQRELRLRIFATDLNAAAIRHAQAGSYPASIADDISPERLRRFFSVSMNGAHEIDRALRARCEFARHNALTDPPLADMDFISCRNLLIYLDEAMQRQLAGALHGALKPTGRLWLGSSERIDRGRELFHCEDAQHRIYAKRPA